jgi:hypothetical protein
MALATRPIELLHHVSNVYRIMRLTPAEVSNYLKLKYVKKVTARARAHPQLYRTNKDFDGTQW